MQFSRGTQCLVALAIMYVGWLSWGFADESPQGSRIGPTLFFMGLLFLMVGAIWLFALVMLGKR